MTMAEDAKQGGVKGTPSAKTPSKKEIDLQKKVAELEKQQKQLMQEKTQFEERSIKAEQELAGKEVAKVEEGKIQPSTLDPEVATVIKNLQSQVQDLNRQVSFTLGAMEPGKRPLYRPVTPEDWQEESVIFTARSVLYIVASYKDSKGIEIIPPHGVIVFQYAASDIRKTGREEEVLNYCQYVTNLKTDIEFLRNHPHYGIAFSENTNVMMAEDVRETQFKVRAASTVNAMSPQALYEKCRNYEIPYHGLKLPEIKILVIHKMSEEFVASAKKIEGDRQKRIAVGMHHLENKK